MGSNRYVAARNNIDSIRFINMIYRDLFGASWLKKLEIYGIQ